ncbi:MAG: antitoxin [Ignavibacteria bacterium]|nr:antitoxin [Ignavibacteria bacterium]
MTTAKLFRSGKSQVVKLPKSFCIKGDEAYISKIGEAIILLPKKGKWDSLFSAIKKFSSDFMNERTQPNLEKRDKLFS